MRSPSIRIIGIAITATCLSLSAHAAVPSTQPARTVPATQHSQETTPKPNLPSVNFVSVQ